MLIQLEERLLSTRSFGIRGTLILKIRMKLNRITSLDCLYDEVVIYDTSLDGC